MHAHWSFFKQVHPSFKLLQFLCLYREAFESSRKLVKTAFTYRILSLFQHHLALMCKKLIEESWFSIPCLLIGWLPKKGELYELLALDQSSCHGKWNRKQKRNYFVLYCCRLSVKLLWLLFKPQNKRDSPIRAIIYVLVLVGTYK